MPEWGYKKINVMILRASIQFVGFWSPNWNPYSLLAHSLKALRTTWSISIWHFITFFSNNSISLSATHELALVCNNYRWRIGVFFLAFNKLERKKSNFELTKCGEKTFPCLTRKASESRRILGRFILRSDLIYMTKPSSRWHFARFRIKPEGIKRRHLLDCWLLSDKLFHRFIDSVIPLSYHYHNLQERTELRLTGDKWW